jgi:hypothetical protein
VDIWGVGGLIINCEALDISSQLKDLGKWMQGSRAPPALVFHMVRIFGSYAGYHDSNAIVTSDPSFDESPITVRPVPTMKVMPPPIAMGDVGPAPLSDSNVQSHIDLMTDQQLPRSHHYLPEISSMFERTCEYSGSLLVVDVLADVEKVTIVTVTWINTSHSQYLIYNTYTAST